MNTYSIIYTILKILILGVAHTWNEVEWYEEEKDLEPPQTEIFNVEIILYVGLICS